MFCQIKSQTSLNMLVLLGGLFCSFQIQAEHPELPEITVSGEQIDSFSSSLYDPNINAFTSPDAASALERIPGGSLNYNGQLSGQMQYRGMFGPRMNTRIDGMYINSGGPNWMDPPLHYLPGALVESVRVQRGIASVSKGSGIGGYVDARTRSSHFVDSDSMVFDGDVQLDGHSVDGGFDGSGFFSTSNKNHRIHLLGSYEHGDDLEFGDGELAGTEYRRSYVRLGYGFKSGVNEFALDGWKVNSGPNGTPALPLDIEFFDSGFVNSSFQTRLGQFDIKAKVFASDIDHRMNNFQLRPTPDIATLPPPFFAGTDERFVNAEGNGFGYGLTASTTLMGGTINFGMDGHLSQHSATVGDPGVDNFDDVLGIKGVHGFFITNFNDAEVNQFGFFTEWVKDDNDPWGVEAGLRVNVVNTDAGFVDATPAILADGGVALPPIVAAQTLRNTFNASDRSKSDTNVDAVLKFDYDLSNWATVELGFARKVRSPSHIERYLWIPLEVNAGLGDGNNYIGNPNLDPEKSHQVELGLNLRTTNYYFTPRIYYRRVDDYIQGAAATNASAIIFSTLAAGDATPLVFSNVDAEIYGFDADAGYAFNSHWRLDGAIAYTRGKRRDIDDNLFRIAPLNGRLGLTYSRNNWSTTIETVAFAEQHDVSDSITFDPANAKNNNESTSGYALLNLYGIYQFTNNGFRLQGGIENLLDEDYIDHLSGFNRNSASDIAIGERLHGGGRNIFANLTYNW